MFFRQKHQSTYGHLLVWLGFLYVTLICANLGLVTNLLTSELNEIREERISLYPDGIYATMKYRAEHLKENYTIVEGNNENIDKAIKDSFNRNPTRLHVCVKSRNIDDPWSMNIDDPWSMLGTWIPSHADNQTKETIKRVCSESLPINPPAPNWYQGISRGIGKIWSNVRDTFARFLGEGGSEEKSGQGVASVEYDIDGIRILEANFTGSVGQQEFLIRVFDTDRPDILAKNIIESVEGESLSTYNTQFMHYRDLIIAYFIAFLISATVLSLILSWIICRGHKSFRQLLGRMSKRLKEATALVLDDRALETRIGKEEYPASIADEVEEINMLLEAVERKEQERKGEFEAQHAGLRQVYCKIMLQAAIIPMYISHDEGKGLRSIKKLADEAVAEDWERKATGIARTASELEHGLKEVRRQLIRLSLGDVAPIGERMDVLAILENQLEFARMTAKPGLIFDDTHVNTFSCTTRQFEFPRILQNVFDNAKKYGERQILVGARICEDEDKVEIVIENDGAALPPGQEEKDRLLEWGHRAGLHLKEGGNGIGLALAAMWLRESGGEIKLTESEMEGGARVTIRLEIS